MDRICARRLRLRYGQTDVVEQLDLTVTAGEIVCLFGPSGCGKSTILKAVLGVVSPYGGTIHVDGISAADYRQPIAYLPQDNELFRWLKVGDNVALWHKESSVVARTRSGMTPEKALDVVELTAARQKLPSQLSGGMARRAALARCLATSSQLMLLDEAFVSVERRLRRKLMQQIRSHLKMHEIAAILVSHDYEEATYVADRVVFISAPPAKVTAVVEVPLPEQRSEDLFGSDEFREATLHLVRNAEGTRDS